MTYVYKVYEVKIKMLATRAMSTTKNEVFIVYWVYSLKIVIYIVSENLVEGVCQGEFFLVEAKELIFCWWEESPHPPSLENPDVQLFFYIQYRVQELREKLGVNFFLDLKDINQSFFPAVCKTIQLRQNNSAISFRIFENI